MGKSLKRKFRSLKNIFCCCTRNRVAPASLDEWRTLTRISEAPLAPVPKFSNDKAPVAPESVFNIVEAPTTSDALSSLPSPTSSVSDREFRSSRLTLHGSPGCVSADTVAAIRDLAGINIAKIVSVSKSKTRVINYYSDQPEDTPLPYFIWSVETNATVGIAIRGSFSQDTLGPMFSNAQCTSMAYQSLAYKKLMGQPDTWNYRDIDSILCQGHLLHSHFRYVMKLSTNKDNRIAIHELPLSYDVQVLPPTCTPGNGSSDLIQKVHVVFLYGIDGMYAYNSPEIAKNVSSFAPEFPMFILQTFTTGNSEDLNMILTINDFTMAIWRRRNEDTIWLFDSHRRDATGLGHAFLTWGSESYDTGAALARSFTGVSGLVGHITEIYGDSFYYNARFYNLDMVDSDGVPPAAGNDADGVMDDRVSTLDDSLPVASLDEEKHPP
ncbi:uncharacterized protein LOC110446773 isoform X2 [Mizuhopecten yessoensis]|uniref:uncharacterized protein LOC110446773 isoform X2 n=1 Tax=Mizuhopecten yessoensis TaxID=6573 RepID=UPI000B45D15A|nr:uncharacterized protein LOC110446773 isoform X2 [Mizuhopecten yessoensis]